MNEPALIKTWVSDRLTTVIERRLNKLATAHDVRHIAVMPDVHLAGDVCNGVVVATDGCVYPQAIGGDIGCGYLAVAINADADKFTKAAAAAMLARLYRAVPLNKRSTNNTSGRHQTHDTTLASPQLDKAASREGRLQLGTLGRGNHFIELQCDQSNRLWLLIHSGSRAMGPLISSHHLAHAELDSASGLKFLEAESPTGEAWLNDHSWARQYAAANRLAMLDAIHDQVLTAIDATIDYDTLVDIDHNHVQRETHAGTERWVHRKGAQRLLAGQHGVIPGSMGTTTYVVSGRRNDEALNSCSHGAGRQMSRSEAASRLSPKKLRRELAGVWYDQRQLNRLLDEAPSAYKDIRKVMKAQRDLVRIVDQRTPLLNFKGR